MFFKKNKIRKLIELLDSGKRPADLNEIATEIQKNAPQPNAAFEKALRKKLMIHHKNVLSNAPAIEETRIKSSFFNYKFLQFRWQYATIVLVIALVGGMISYPFIPAPAVEGYSLKDAVRKISYNAPIKVVFTQPMDHGSVEKSFSINPQIEGSYAWQGNSLLYVPKQGFKVGEKYNVSVSKAAKSLIQKSLEYDYQEVFEITGPPQVVLFNPATDFTGVASDSKITIMFDRPMTSLKSLDEGEKSFPDIKILPEVKGRFKWLGTNAVMFIPERLQYSTKYEITIPKGTKSADGGSTDQDFKSSFTTAVPALINVTPYSGYTYNGSDTRIKLEFNQPMDLNKVKDFIKLEKVSGITEQTQKDPNYLKQNAGKFTWENVDYSARYLTKKDVEEENKKLGITDAPEIDESTLNKTMLLIPNKGLPLKGSFVVSVEKDLPPAEGTFNLETPTYSYFETVGELKVNATMPAEGQKVTDALYYFEIRMSHPVMADGIENFVKISPERTDKDTKEVEKPSVSMSEDDVVILIRYDFLPSTNYTVTLVKGLKDKFGQEMKDDFSFKFRTADRKPSFNLMSRSDLSILDANKPLIYYIKSVNIDYADINFKPLNPEEFKSVYRRGYVDDYAMRSIAGPFTSFQKKINTKFNEDIYTTLDLPKDTGSQLNPGVYYLAVSNPNVVDESGNPVVQRQIFIVTYTALAAKRSENELLVWATSLKDGSPVAGENLNVSDNNGNIVFTGTTDKNGLASFKLPEVTAKDESIYPDDYTIGSSNNDFAFVNSSWGEGVAPWDFSIDYSAVESQYYVYTYTDRPIYRPGHTVYFKGLVRKDVDAKFELPGKQKIKVEIEDSQGESVYSKDLELKSNGTYFDEFTLGDKARTGNYTIKTTLVDAPGPEYLNTSYSSFRIAEYRKPDYELTLQPEKENYVNGEKARIKVKGAYFFGAPMPNAPIEWTVKSQDYYFFLNSDSKSPFASQWFSFSDEGYMCYWGCQGNSEVVTSGKAKLDAKGEYVIELPLDISQKKLSQIYTVEVTAYDLNNQTVSNRTMLPVHEGSYYVGILSENYVSSVNQPAKFDLVTVDFDGMPVPNTDIEVGLYKRTWNTVKKKNVDSGFYYENSFDDKLIEKKNVRTNGEAKAVAEFTAKEGGDFKVVAVAKDGRGNTITASTTYYVTSGEFINWGRDNNDKIELVPDKMEYKPGETAHILVKSPYTNVWALVTQERGTILDRKIIKLNSNSETIDVPISEKSIPNVFVSVLLVKGSGNQAGLNEPPAGANDERAVAAFKAGYATLQVDNESKRLNIEVATDKAKYAPKEQVVIKVKTTDQNGKPIKADLSIGVVDKSVLSLTENVTADLLNAFYRKRFLGVLTSETLTKAISRVNLQVEAGMKGGGGAIKAKRGLFKDTAKWEASLKTNDHGYGELMFTLPDNLTTWEILAIGISDNTLVGSRKTEFLVTKDVLVRPVLPRFMTVKDEMKIGAIVHNYTDKNGTYSVKLDAKGVELKDPANQTISLNSGEEKKVEWALNVLNEKEGVFDFTVEDTSNTMVGDRLEQIIPIQPFSFPETVATSETFDDNAKHVQNILLPLGIDPNFGKLTISVAPTLTASLSKGLEYLTSYPYGCVEQTTSALLPNVVLKQLISLPTIDDSLIDAAKLQKNVEAGLQAIYKYQNENGGWGIWETSQPGVYLTSYVLFTLNETKKAGYAVDQNVMNRGIEYLRNALNSYSPQKITPEMSAFQKYEEKEKVNERAYAIFVLTELGQPDIGSSKTLLDYNSLNIFSKAYLAMALDKISKSSSDNAFKTDLVAKIDQLKKEILAEAKETPRGVHFEEKEKLYKFFDTDDRTTAIVLQMLSRIDPGHPYIPKIVRHLLNEKKGGHFSSTQETAMSLLGMIEYLKSSKELEASYNAIVSVNGQEKLNKSYSGNNISEQSIIEMALTELQPDNQDNEIVVSKNGVGKVYSDINLQYYLPTEEIKPRDEGILVVHEYFNQDDKKMETPINQIKVGENMKVRVTVVVPEDRYYVMVEDYLPAGLEGIDFNLKTSQQSMNDYTGYTKGDFYWDNPVLRFNYSEFRDDRVMYFADYLPKGVYEIEYFVRATTPGVFHDMPVLAQELYFPEVFGRSQGQMFTVVE